MTLFCFSPDNFQFDFHMKTFGTEHQVTGFIEDFIRNNSDLTPAGIIEKLDLLNVDYNKVSSGGHFGKGGLPWEE